VNADTRLIAERYRLEQQIGAGAMGVVWRAHDVRLDRTVAVKQLLMQPGLDETEAEAATARAMREGRIAARLQHPHAIGVYDVALDDIHGFAPERHAVPWLIMEYLQSRSLAAVLAQKGTLPPRDVARIGRQVAAALAAAHSAGIVHRDVKPGNVLLGVDGMVKITDFGISRASWEAAVTRTGVVAGTPAYFAPEVARGEPRDPAADVFSLGSTLYAAVEGEPPFGLDDNTLALLRTIAEGRILPPRQAGPLATLLMQMLRDDPAQRPSMREAMVALGAVARGGIPVRVGGLPPSPPTPAVVDLRLVAPSPKKPPAPKRIAAQHTLRPEQPLPAIPGQDRPGQPGIREHHPPPGRAGWRRRAVLLGIAACLLVLFGVLALAAEGVGNRQSADISTGPSPSPDSAGPPSPGPPVPNPPVSDPPGPAELEQTVRGYYGLLPEQAAVAWDFLGAPERAKARGFAEYLEFWNGVDEVRIRGPVEVQGNTVLLNLRFELKSGRQSLERYRLTMGTTADGRVLITSSSLIGSFIPGNGDPGERTSGDN
jgi:eukaryotic-like serine/threonine-protein kinase